MSFLGERLRQERETRAITPLQVEIDTRIRTSVILALEEGDLSHLPPEPFLRGLIRSYSNYLGVDADEMLELHAADSAPPAAPPGRPPFTHQPSPPAPPPPAPTPTPPAIPVPRPARTGPPPAYAAPDGHPPPPPAYSPPASLSEQSNWAQTPIPTATPSGFEATAPPPPEAYEPPEYVFDGDAASAPPPFLAHMSRRDLPLPVIALVALALVLFCIAVTLVAVTRIGPAVLSASSARSTAARPAAAFTPPLVPGAAPTAIPMLAVTAQPFATFPGNSAPSTPIVQTPGIGDGLELDVDVTQTITLRVAVDNVVAFDGQMDPGSSRSWTANSVLYVRVENPGGATLTFNGSTKWFGARNYAERGVLERQWTLNDRGTPVSVTPVAPAASTPTASRPNAPASLPAAAPTTS